MRYWVGITDWDWFQFLRARQTHDEMSFWQPSAGRRPVNLERDAAFLFKLHASGLAALRSPDGAAASDAYCLS